MKKIIILIITMMLIVSACGRAENINGNNEKNANGKNNQQKNSENSSNIENKNEVKILIAYFSRAGENYNVGTVDIGSTELIAGHIKEYLGDKADVFKIDPVIPYPVGYEDTKTISTREKDNNERPAFKGDVDISQYDVILLGYPIWYGDYPMIINTFLEKYDFSGKTIIPFNTHEGSGNAGTFSRLKSKTTGATVNMDGFTIAGTAARQTASAKEATKNWLKGLGY